MSDFVWIIPAEKLSSLKSGGISANYIIPKGQMHGQEKRLGTKRLWIVLRNIEDRCIALVKIKQVEKFNEGYYINDFLISCDTTVSFRLSSSFEGAKPYSISDFQNFEIGVHQINKDSSDKLSDKITANVQVKLARPAEAALKRVTFNITPRKGLGLAKAALSQITQTFPLDQIWASGIGAKLGPFGNFTSQLLYMHGYESLDAVGFLKENDPTSLLRIDEGAELLKTQKNSTLTFNKVVDLDFTEIDPKTIYAREYVSSENLLSDLESALNKTEAAEKLHQEMLRDIASYLKTQHIQPYESSSIDLMILNNEETKLFEIKSSTPENILAQAAKGAFQLACYINAMMNEYNPLKATLILYKIEQVELEAFVHNALDRLGIRYLTYDPTKKWPDKVNGLLN